MEYDEDVEDAIFINKSVVMMKVDREARKVACVEKERKNREEREQMASLIVAMKMMLQNKKKDNGDDENCKEQQFYDKQEKSKKIKKKREEKGREGMLSACYLHCMSFLCPTLQHIIPPKEKNY